MFGSRGGVGGQPEGDAEDGTRAYGAALDSSVPGPELAALLAGAHLPDLSDLRLMDSLAACGELKSWVAAVEAGLLAELTLRTERFGGEPAEFLADEVSAALRTTRRTATALLERATFLRLFPEVHDELAWGRLSERKVDVLNDGTAHLPVDDARKVLSTVLPRASALTPPGLRDAVRRADLREDPARAAARAARARQERSVWMEPAPDCMAYLRALLPATDAVRVMTGLDALAAAAAPEDERTLDQRRADALTDCVGRVLDTGVGPDGTPLPTRQGRRPHLQITATLEAVAGLSETPAELAGYGPVTADVAREIARSAAWTPVTVDPRTGEVAGRSTRRYRPTPGLVGDVLSRDVTCTFPGCRVPAERCDLDHVVPFQDGGGDDQTRLGNLAALCRHHHRMKTAGGWEVRRDHQTGVTWWRSRMGGTYSRDPNPVPVEPFPERLPRPTVAAGEPSRPPSRPSAFPPAPAGSAPPGRTDPPRPGNRPPRNDRPRTRASEDSDDGAEPAPPF